MRRVRNPPTVTLNSSEMEHENLSLKSLRGILPLMTAVSPSVRTRPDDSGLAVPKHR